MRVPHAIMGRVVLAAGISVSMLLGGAGSAQAQPPGPDEAGAENVVIAGYIDKQIQCTPDTAPAPLSISWDPPGFVAGSGGSGMINDANPALGGHFLATWVGGQWDVEYQFC